MSRRLFVVSALALLVWGCSKDPETCEGAKCGDGGVDLGVDAGVDADDTDPDTGGAAGFCGDGTTDSDEACDDGNDVDDDACRNDCTLPSCGDGILDELEACDDGAQNGDAPDGCRMDCSLASCGDGVVDPGLGEVCDDGNTEPGDGCNADCTSDESYGNGIVDFGEECDDGNLLSNDGCASDSRDETLQLEQVVINPPVNGEVVGQVFDANRRQLLRFTQQGTWVLEGRGWRRASAISPATSLDEAACANDVARGTVVCFSWRDSATTAFTTVWNGAEWRTVTDGPPARRVFALAYDSRRERVVLFGGLSGNATAGVPEVFHNDTWEWDGEAWTEIDAPTKPTPMLADIAYHPQRGEVVMAGGEAGAIAVNQTWTFDGTDWTKIADTTPAGGPLRWEPQSQQLVAQGQGQTFALTASDTWDAVDLPLVDPWTEYWNGEEYTTTNPVKEAGPAALAYRSAAYNPIAGQIMLAGGAPGSSIAPDPVTIPAEPTRLYGADGWSTGPTAPASLRPGLAYDASDNVMVLNSADTHVWNGTEWTTITGGATTERFPALAWDPNLGAVIRFGGKDGPFVYGWPGDPPPPTMFGDTERWTGSAWVTVGAEDQPAPRWLANAVWDAAHDRVAIFGGLVPRTACCDYLADFFWFDRAAYETRSVLTPDTAWSATAYDAHRKVLLSFGGYNTDSPSVWSETFSEKADGAPWQPLNVVGPADPFPAMAFHALYRRTILFAGADLWEFGYGDVLEQCTTGLDGDGDGLVGCADPDCWGYCTPECPPGATCPTDADRCGDDVCNANLETSRLCPADCGEPVARCGDYICDPGESAAECPGDCG